MSINDGSTSWGSSPAPPPALSSTAPEISQLISLILMMVGGRDGMGNPFFKLPSFTPDTRTATERAYGPNFNIFESALRKQDSKISTDMLKAIGFSDSVAENAIASEGLTMAMQMAGMNPFSLQDPTYGAIKESMKANSGRIMSARSGFNISTEGAYRQSATDVANLYGAAHRSIWGKNGIKDLSFTYGLSEAEMTPIFEAAFESGQFSENLDKVRSAQEREDTAARVHALTKSVGKTSTADAKDVYSNIQNTVSGIDDSNKLEAAISRLEDSINKNTESLKGKSGEDKKAAEAELERQKLELSLIKEIKGKDGTIDQEKKAEVTSTLAETQQYLDKNQSADTKAGLNAARDARVTAQDALDKAVKEETKEWVRAKSIGVDLFGKDTDKVISAMYGAGVYYDKGLANTAAEKLSQLSAIAQNYGINKEIAGNVWKSTHNAATGAMGIENDESSVGFGQGFGADIADATMFSTSNMVRNYINDYKKTHGGKAPGAAEVREQFGKFSLGNSKRLSHAAGSEQMRLQVMLQHAKANGYISDEQFKDLSFGLMSGDRKTRENAVSEFFDTAYGGYQQGLDIFSDDNRIGLMYDNMSNQSRREVMTRVGTEINNQDKRAVENAELTRRRSTAAADLRKAGRSGSRINTSFNEGKIKSIEGELRRVSGGDDIIRAAQEAASSAKTPEERARILSQYYDKAVSTFLDPDKANDVLTAGERGGVAALEAESDSEYNRKGKALGDKLELARGIGGLSDAERRELSEVQELLREGKTNEAEAAYNRSSFNRSSRGRLVNNKIEKRTKDEASRRQRQRSRNGELDKGAAATNGGMGLSEANALGETVLTDASEIDKKAGETLLNQTKAAAEAGEQSGPKVVIQSLTGEKGTGISNPEYNPNTKEKPSAIHNLEDLRSTIKDALTDWLKEPEKLIKTVAAESKGLE